ncbi:MAG: hypothetical protein CL462_12275 [Acidimicrobiaceae bacterium]|nr:hypothetical protein [Acidimicrobiaceae bacterium]
MGESHARGTRSHAELRSSPGFRAERGVGSHPIPGVGSGGSTKHRSRLCFWGALRVRDHEGLPGNSPPWGTLNSIDLATGEIDWQIPFGDYPETEGLGFGAENYGGPVVTASGLIFIGATPDRKFRAYDVRDGEVLWEAELSAAGFATPAMYSVDGQQYVVIAAGGGRRGPPSGSEYVAFSLPKSE